MDLSLCMIVKDEALTLTRCLERVQPFVDEMIILDTGSKDATVTLAQGLGAQVYHFPWQDDFAQARNEALKYVHGDWILVLDADELLIPEQGKVLRQVIQDPDLILINLLRQEIGAKQSPYSLISRLFRRHPQVYFTRPYHALVDDTVAALMQTEPQWRVGYVPGVALLHEGYQPGAIQAKDKLARARRAMERFYHDHPHDPYVCSKLGALYVETGAVEQGIQLLETGLHHADTAQVRYELRYHLGLAEVKQGNTAQAQAHYLAALDQPVAPLLHLGARINLGNLLQRQGDLKGAQSHYQRAIQIDPTFAVAHYNLGLVLRAQGQLSAAIACYEQALKLDPQQAEAWQNLGVVRFKLGQMPQAKAAFQRAIQIYETQGSGEADRLRQGLCAIGVEL